MKISYKKARLAGRQGFTLIELLVVIAIIGILASVVLASLNTARNKGNNAKMKSQLSGLRVGAEVYYDNNGQSYAGMCAVGASDTSGLFQYLQASNYPGNVAPICNQTATAYAATIQLSVAEGANTHWCVDSVGNSRGRPSALPVGSTGPCTLP